MTEKTPTCEHEYGELKLINRKEDRWSKFCKKCGRDQDDVAMDAFRPEQVTFIQCGSKCEHVWGELQVVDKDALEQSSSCIKCGMDFRSYALRELP